MLTGAFRSPIFALEDVCPTITPPVHAARGFSLPPHAHHTATPPVVSVTCASRVNRLWRRVYLGRNGRRAGLDMAWSRESRHKRGYGAQWERLRAQAMRRDMYLCQPCKRAGRVTPASAVDHIMPKAKGGADDLANLQSICGPCHDDKTAADEGRKRARKVGLDGYPL